MTEITRGYYRRDGLPYGRDTTDAEWFLMEPLLPPASALGRRRATNMRTVIDEALTSDVGESQSRSFLFEDINNRRHAYYEAKLIRDVYYESEHS